jgi:hypothetical protein
MPDNNPDQKQDSRDEARDEQRVRSSNDSHQRLDDERTKRQVDREQDAPPRKSQDTDPDSPDADINRDDMSDEP